MLSFKFEFNTSFQLLEKVGFDLVQLLILMSCSSSSLSFSSWSRSAAQLVLLLVDLLYFWLLCWFMMAVIVWFGFRFSGWIPGTWLHSRSVALESVVGWGKCECCL